MALRCMALQRRHSSKCSKTTNEQSLALPKYSTLAGIYYWGQNWTSICRRASRPAAILHQTAPSFDREPAGERINALDCICETTCVKSKFCECDYAHNPPKNGTQLRRSGRKGSGAGAVIQSNWESSVSRLKLWWATCLSKEYDSGSG
jgi:hypothetical protein